MPAPTSAPPSSVEPIKPCALHHLRQRQILRTASKGSSNVSKNAADAVISASRDSSLVTSRADRADDKPRGGVSANGLALRKGRQATQPPPPLPHRKVWRLGEVVERLEQNLKSFEVGARGLRWSWFVFVDRLKLSRQRMNRPSVKRCSGQRV
jgi:hypothetical protein